MIFRRPRLKILFLLSLLVLVSAGAGFFVGIGLASAINKKKEDPKFWKQAAMKHLQKLHPSDEQKKKFEARTDSAVQELSALRKGAIKDVWQIVERAVADIDTELTAGQREVFTKIKPKAPPEAR